MTKTTARILVIIFVILLILSAIALIIATGGNSRYYQYRDFAIAACTQGDMRGALNLIQTAIGYATDPDLINEGLHYKALFERDRCEE